MDISSENQLFIVLGTEVNLASVVNFNPYPYKMAPLAWFKVEYLKIRADEKY